MILLSFEICALDLPVISIMRHDGACASGGLQKTAVERCVPHMASAHSPLYIYWIILQKDICCRGLLAVLPDM